MDASAGTGSNSLVDDELAEEPIGPAGSSAMPFSIDEAKETITARGRERGGFVTSDDLLEGLPVEDLSPEQLEEFLTQVEDHLRQEGIEIIEVPGEEFEEESRGLRLPRDDELLKAPTNDPV